MSRPTPDQVRELVAKLRRTDWRDLERRLVEALDRDTRGGSNRPDGYKTSHAPTGGRGDAELTSTEAAANARGWGRTERDRLHESVEQAFGYLDQAAMSVSAMRTRLDNIDDLTADAPLDRRWCEDCENAGLKQAPAHYGTVGGRLDRNADLCEDHYRYVCDNGTRATVEQTQHHDRTGRWRLRAS